MLIAENKAICQLEKNMYVSYNFVGLTKEIEF